MIVTNQIKLNKLSLLHHTVTKKKKKGIFIDLLASVKINFKTMFNTTLTLIKNFKKKN